MLMLLHVIFYKNFKFRRVLDRDTYGQTEGGKYEQRERERERERERKSLVILQQYHDIPFSDRDYPPRSVALPIAIPLI